MTVGATADYAHSFLVYYGDVTNETGTPLALGATLPAHIYPAGGPFDLRVVALSGGGRYYYPNKNFVWFPAFI